MIELIPDSGANLYLNLKRDPCGDPDLTIVYLGFDIFYFPSRDWVDFASAVSRWKDQLNLLVSDGECELWFLDGPYEAKVIEIEPHLFEFRFFHMISGQDSDESRLTLPRSRSVDLISEELHNWSARRGLD